MTTTTSLAAATTAATTAATALSKNTSDYTMFLKLLTTQMQNQDPLKPMDSTEYTSQLAQFSQVEQTIKQTTALSDILSQLSTQNLAQASSLIGREAVVDSAVSGLTAATPAQWSYTGGRDVASIEMSITNSSGKVVAKQTVAGDGTDGRLTWDGTLADGSKAAAGAYTLSATGSDASGIDVPLTIAATGKVMTVESVSGAVTLGINGIEVPMAKLVRLADTAG